MDSFFKQKALQRLIRDMLELIQNPTEKNLYWVESKTDLMEALHEVYTSGEVYSYEGRPVAFRMLRDIACDRLHVVMNYNPSQMVYRAKRKKGIRAESFVVRFTRLMKMYLPKDTENTLIKYEMVVRI